MAKPLGIVTLQTMNQVTDAIRKQQEMKMPEAMGPCPPDSALMKAWEAHKATEEYANSFSWATRYIPEDDPAEIERVRQSGANPWTHQMKMQAAEGSLWAMFSTGWSAAGGANPFTGARS